LPSRQIASSHCHPSQSPTMMQSPASIARTVYSRNDVRVTCSWRIR
jgi:hypothetical protein